MYRKCSIYKSVPTDTSFLINIYKSSVFILSLNKTHYFYILFPNITTDFSNNRLQILLCFRKR